MNKYYPENTDLRYVDISHEQEKQLFRDARDGDDEAREFLIKNHLLFALNQGRLWSKGKLPEDEVASAANYALLQAFDKFDVGRGVRFSSYLKQWIRSAIADLWKEQNIVRSPQGDEDRGPVPNSTTGPTTHGLEQSVNHPVEADDHQQFILKCLDECRTGLPPEESEVLGLYYGESPCTFEEIGLFKNLTRQRIEQIHAAGLRKLRALMADKLEAAGVTYR